MLHAVIHCLFKTIIRYFSTFYLLRTLVFTDKKNVVSWGK